MLELKGADGWKTALAGVWGPKAESHRHSLGSQQHGVSATTTVQGSSDILGGKGAEKYRHHLYPPHTNLQCLNIYMMTLTSHWVVTGELVHLE